MTKARSVPVLAWWLGMSVNDVEDAEKAGVELKDIRNFWRGNTLEHMRAIFCAPIDEKEHVQIPGGVIQLKDEAMEKRMRRLKK